MGPGALQVLAGVSSRLGGWLLPRSVVRRLERLARPEATFARWAICALIRWRPSRDTRNVCVFHIHGEADKVLLASLARTDVMVKNGEHALSLFNCITQVPRSIHPFETDFFGSANS